MSILGLVGPHRSGKTSLARAYAAKHGLQFLETTATAVFKELGVDPALPMPFSTRLDVQELIMERFEAIYKTASLKQGAIADRTPLDFAAYTLADAAGGAVPEDQQARFAAYIDKCFAMTNKYFSAVMLVQPGIPLVSVDGKAAMSLAFMESLNFSVRGMLTDDRLTCPAYHLPRRVLDMDQRVATLEVIVRRITQKATDEFNAFREEKRQSF